MSVRCPQVDSTAALSVALQHRAVSSDLKVICTLVQVCKSWRATVQQSTAGHTSVYLAADRGKFQLSKLAGFAAWFPKHPGVVGSLSIGLPERSITPNYDNKTPVGSPDALLILELSMQHAAVGAAHHSRLMRLSHLSIVGLISHSILSALPTASLRHLNIEAKLSEERCLEAISKLSSLRKLSLSLSCSDRLDSESLTHLARLSQLTRLRLLDFSTAGPLQLPKQLHQLTLQCNFYENSPHIDLRYLTCLQKLQIKCASEPAAGVALPAQLQVLDVNFAGNIRSQQPSALEAFSLPKLQELRFLSLGYSGDSAEQLEQLADHPRLQQLLLRAASMTAVTKAAAVWQSIAQLCSLSITEARISASDFQQLVQHVTAVTSLTKLELRLLVDSPMVPGAADGESPCKHLAQLTQLRELGTWYGNAFNNPAALGAHHLSALTALTKLYHAGLPVVDETTAVQLAVKLTNLEWWSMIGGTPNGGVQWSTAPLPAIGQLTRLQRLELANLSDEAAETGRSYLTDLTRLSICSFGLI